MRPRPDHGSFYSLFKLRVQAIQLGIAWPDDSNAQKRLRLWLRQREVGLRMRAMAAEHRGAPRAQWGRGMTARIVRPRQSWGLGFRNAFLFRVIAVQAEVMHPNDRVAQRAQRQHMVWFAVQMAAIRRFRPLGPRYHR